MALASVTYDGSQGTGPYPIPFHVPRANELVVTVGGVVKTITTDWTIDSPNLNVTLLVSAGGAEVVISRETSLDEDDFPVTFTNGAAITKQNLDTAFHHLLHALQEHEDHFDEVDGVDGEPGLVWTGPWSALTNYEVGDAVEYDGSSYIALTDHINEQPDISPGDWDLLAQKGDDGAPGAPGVGDEGEIFMGYN